MEAKEWVAVSLVGRISVMKGLRLTEVVFNFMVGFKLGKWVVQ